MQSGFCSYSCLEMASKRMITFIFENAEKIKYKNFFLVTVSTKDILACRKVKHFCKKDKLNSIKKIITMSGFWFL